MTTTISWITGEVGFAYVTVPDGFMNQDNMAKLNEQYKGVMVTESTGTDSHMWNGQTTVKFLQHMTVELRKQRARIGCNDASARALILCDKCTSHTSQTYLDLRRQWAKEQNVLLLGADDSCDIKIPGGWGATSSPNDGWHGHYHLLRMTYMRCALHMPRNPLYRQELEESEAGPNGALPSITCPVEVSFAADAWALSTIGTYKGGKVITWAWMSRGCLSTIATFEVLKLVLVRHYLHYTTHILSTCFLNQLFILLTISPMDTHTCEPFVKINNHIHIHIFTISPPGYLSEMDAAEWHHSGSIEELQENMRIVRNGYQTLLKLKEIPILDKSIWVINYIETFCLFYGGVFKGKMFELSCFLRALQDV